MLTREVQIPGTLRHTLTACVTAPDRYRLELTAIGLSIGALGYMLAGWLF